MLNGDVLTDIDLTAQIAQHEETGAVGTLALVPVEDPTAYGLVRTHEDHSVREFVEKPTADSIDTNLISAGAYVLERRVLDLIPAGPQRLDRARGLAAARRRRPVRVRRRRVLARHRDARALPPGHLRHPRGQRADRRHGPPRRGLRRRRRPRRDVRAHRPAGGRRARLPDRGGRPRRQPRRARRRRHRGGGLEDRALGRPQRQPRSGRAARCRTASSPPACASARARSCPAGRCSARG